MTKSLRVFICAGEASGDCLGGWFMENFGRLAESKGQKVSWLGMGGPDMQARAQNSLTDMSAVQTAGMVELLPRLPEVLRRYLRLKRLAAESKPDLAVLVDFPDFNLRLAGFIHERGIPVLYYVAPQLWAWRPGRIEILKRSVDGLAVLFPFEEDWFRARGVAAFYVGHPLLETIPEPGLETDWGENITIGLFPGSRTHEVEAILPVQLAAARLLDGQTPDSLSFQIHAAAGRETQIMRIQKESGSDFNCVGGGYDCDMAWCAAGTATLELALAGVVWLLTHRVRRLSYWMARRWISTACLAMPNILLKRMVAPELVQNDCRPEAIARHTVRLLSDGGERRRIRRAWLDMRRLFEHPRREGGAAEVAWKLISSLRSE